jgi:RNA polymerase sigma-70 factor (ECF subfamily)
VSTAQDLPLPGAPAPYGEPPQAAPAVPLLRLVPSEPLDFDEAVRRVRPRLQRYAVRRLGDAHEAEELVQEALLRAYTHREQLLTEDDLSAWTTVVTGRLVIDRLRVRNRCTSVAEVPEGTRVGRDTADVVVARDEARTALDALDAMPGRQAALLWAREVEGRTYEDLCARFSMTEPAVRSVLTRARKSLRKEYALRGGTLPVGGLAVLAPWVAGFSWADKLRRAASRLTAPAALGAVGITALGGLVLSPFGAVPPAGSAVFSPSQSVVTSTAHAAAAVTRTGTAGTGVSTLPGGASRTQGQPAADVARPATADPLGPQGDLGRTLNTTCVGTDSPAGAGGYGCAPHADPASTVLAVDLPAALPTNPLGISHQLVLLSDVPCDGLPVLPLTQCATARGANP